MKIDPCLKLYRQLAVLQRAGAGAPKLAHAAGLSDAQCDALRWVAYLPNAAHAVL